MGERGLPGGLSVVVYYDINQFKPQSLSNLQTVLTIQKKIVPIDQDGHPEVSIEVHQDEFHL